MVANVRGEQPVADIYFLKALLLDRLLANDREELAATSCLSILFKALLLDRLLANDRKERAATSR